MIDERIKIKINLIFYHDDSSKIVYITFTSIDSMYKY